MTAKRLDTQLRDCECEDCCDEGYSRKHPKNVVCWCGAYRGNHVLLREKTHTWLYKDHHFGRHDSLTFVQTEYEANNNLPAGATNPSNGWLLKLDKGVVVP